MTGSSLLSVNAGLIGMTGVSRDICGIIRPRVLVIRCGDHDRYCKPHPKSGEIPMAGFESIYDVAYEHTPPGCCRCFNPLDTQQTAIDELFRQMGKIIPLKQPRWIALISHIGCLAYQDMTWQLNEPYQWRVMGQDQDVARKAILRRFPGFSKSFLRFMLDSSGTIRPVDCFTERLQHRVHRPATNRSAVLAS